MTQAIRTVVRPGDTYYQLVALGPVPKSNGCWRWRCACGQTVERRPGDVRRGYYRSCGCLRLTHLDYHGLKWGRLRFMAPIPSSNGLWDVQCDCGKVVQARPSRVYSGHVVSCGCYRDQTFGARTHYRNVNGITAAARKRNRMHPLRLLFELPKKLTPKGGSRWNRTVVVDGTVVRGVGQDHQTVRKLKRKAEHG